MYCTKMYYIKISYLLPKCKWKVTSVPLTVLAVTNEYYLLKSKEGIHVRGNKVYKSDIKDVASCGYAVLNYPLYGNVDLIEGFARCISLTRENGIKIVKKTLEEQLKNRIEFFNNQLITLNNIPAKL